MAGYIAPTPAPTVLGTHLVYEGAPWRTATAIANEASVVSRRGGKAKALGPRCQFAIPRASKRRVLPDEPNLWRWGQASSWPYLRRDGRWVRAYVYEAGAGSGARWMPEAYRDQWREVEESDQCKFRAIVSVPLSTHPDSPHVGYCGHHRPAAVAARADAKRRRRAGLVAGLQLSEMAIHYTEAS